MAKEATRLDRKTEGFEQPLLSSVSRPSPLGRGNKGEGAKSEEHYRGGFDFSGLIETARELRKKQTPAESVMWELLRGKRSMNLKFRRQHQFGNYIVDFYCHRYKLVIELDGGVHDNDDRKKYDHRRDAYLSSMGLTVLRFKNKDFLADPATALHRIADIISSPTGRGTEGEGIAHPPSH